MILHLAIPVSDSVEDSDLELLHKEASHDEASLILTVGRPLSEEETEVARCLTKHIDVGSFGVYLECDTSTPMERAQNAMECLAKEAIRLAITRYGLSTDIEPGETDNVEQFAAETALALQGIGTCSTGPTKCWNNLLALLVRPG